MKLLTKFALSLVLLATLHAAAHAQFVNRNVNNGNGAFNNTFIQNRNSGFSGFGGFGGSGRNVNVNNGNGAFNNTAIFNSNRTGFGGSGRNFNSNNGNGAFNNTFI